MDEHKHGSGGLRASEGTFYGEIEREKELRAGSGKRGQVSQSQRADMRCNDVLRAAQTSETQILAHAIIERDEEESEILTRELSVCGWEESSLG